MNCDQVRGLLVEYRLDELSDDDKSAIDLHLRQGCLGCIAFEKEIAEGIDLLFDAIPDIPVSPRQRESILESALGPLPKALSSNRSDRHHGIEEPPASRSQRWREGLTYLAAVAAGLGLMMTLAPMRPSTMGPTVSEGEEVSRSGSFAVDPKSFTQDSEITEEKYARTLLVSMQRTKAASKIEGRLLWDALSHEVHFYGKGIPVPHQGTHYVLWLMGDEDQTLVSKALNVDSFGQCKVTAKSTMGEILHVFITLESKATFVTGPSKNVELSLDAKRFIPFPL